MREDRIAETRSAEVLSGLRLFGLEACGGGTSLGPPVASCRSCDCDESWLRSISGPQSGASLPVDEPVHHGL